MLICENRFEIDFEELVVCVILPPSHTVWHPSSSRIKPPTCGDSGRSLHLRSRRHDLRYVRIRLRERTWNSGNCRSHASSIAWILSLGCLEIGETRSRFSSTNNRTNICSDDNETETISRSTVTARAISCISLLTDYPH